MSRSAKSGMFGRLEETLIALILGVMTLLTFYNVFLRYLFNEMIIWAPEAVLILFATLVLLGMSHAVRVNAHLGVDALTNMLSPGPRRILSLIVGAICIAYAALLLKGAWDYWAPYAGMSQTSGRWFPTGFVETRDRAFYQTDQIPMLGIFRWMEGAINMGEAYDQLPRAIPYAMLPIGCGLLLLRLVQAVIDIAAGRRASLIVSHEAEDAIEELSATPGLAPHHPNHPDTEPR